MQALRNSIQDQQQTESGSKFINEDKPQKDAYQAAVQHAKDLINQTGIQHSTNHKWNTNTSSNNCKR